MEVRINLLAVVLAAALSFVVGGLLYNKSVFGTVWGKLTGISPKEQKKGAQQTMIVALLAALVTAYVVAQITYITNRFFSTTSEFWMTDALQSAFWLWLGISATTIVTYNAMEQKRARLTVLTLGTQFATLMTIGVVIGLFRP